MEPVAPRSVSSLDGTPVMIRPRCKQIGFSLIELMAALAISFALLGGLVQVFLSNKQNYLFGEGIARLQENGRFALLLLGHGIRHAGFKNEFANQAGELFEKTLQLKGGIQFSAGQIVAGIDDYDGSMGYAKGSDILLLRYQGALDGEMRNCLGSRIPVTEVNVESYFIRDNILYCQTNGSRTQPLVSGVEDLQVLYGIDDTDDNVIDAWMKAKDLNTISWKNIRTIRFAILVSSINPIVTSPTKQQHELLPMGAVSTAGRVRSFEDRLRRRVLTSTIMLRNTMP